MLVGGSEDHGECPMPQEVSGWAHDRHREVRDGLGLGTSDQVTALKRCEPHGLLSFEDDRFRLLRYVQLEVCVMARSTCDNCNVPEIA